MLHLQSKLLTSFLFLFAILSCKSNTQPSFVNYFYINGNGNYIANNTYQSNVNTLFSTLVSKAETSYGFYSFSYGENVHKVNTIGNCKGDVWQDECQSCLDNSRFLLTRLSPNQKEVIGWYTKYDVKYGTAHNRYLEAPNNKNNLMRSKIFRKVVLLMVKGGQRRSMMMTWLLM
ncbi:hypothetical protein L6164_037364 [Bauhinia variegata]|uniref:Uncharacterized protein n=1 Tax=Bauhinia variegata TaxID=167791 RepID=A0ACB9KJP0_BAUVA|nr:hypothetical protein L6164_037364 [Bauhinia variegata]